MSDLFEGQTMSYLGKFVDDGAGAFTFTIPFEPDSLEVYNYTDAGVDLSKPISIWFKGFPAGDAIQLQKMDNDGGSDAASILLETTNGVTVANTAGGAPAYRAAISGVSQADPCVVTTSAAHGYSTGQIVRITDLGDVGPNATDRGMEQINNLRFKIVVVNSTSFSLQDPVSGEAIDSTNYTAWVAGGNVVLETRVISDPEAYVYDPIVYKLTMGTAVLGSDSDVFYFRCFKYGEIQEWGDLANLR